MTDDELLALEAEQRRRLIELAGSTGAACFLEAALRLRKADRVMDAADAHRLLTQPESSREGRPEVDDAEHLLHMEILLAGGRVANGTQAAAEVALRFDEHLRPSIETRLRRKFRSWPRHPELARYLADLQAGKGVVGGFLRPWIGVGQLVEQFLATVGACPAEIRRDLGQNSPS